MRGFQEHRTKIHAARRANPGNIALRADQPKNPLRASREALIAQLEMLLASIYITGWHLTRLCVDEIEVVSANGLSVLSPEILTTRVNRRVEAGDIDASDATILLKDHTSNEYKFNQIWFLLARQSVSHPSVRKYMTYWGGEALFDRYPDNEELRASLTSIGEPAVIEIKLIASKLTEDGILESVAKVIVGTYEASKGLTTYPPTLIDTCLRRPIAPEHVLRIITAADTDFAALTAERD